ncbi:hypothetical protein MIND_00148100 [Mycena indigotica]|uniref:Uncharacterized protein n=1 Tax=Mycena indigotica TaxID=2126181 RepID=A0A8H6TFH0_9AGAR|nr:uncharacterized protein MIND_00148100 [Mycena indigotica]KAF7316294.1 hypothetical protein MIND_00148100 [Mycena indigotica]
MSFAASPPTPSDEKQEIPPYNPKLELTLEYMRHNHPFDELPPEYYLSARQMKGDPLPRFVYGFEFHFVDLGLDLAPTLAKLHAMQAKNSYSHTARQDQVSPDLRYPEIHRRLYGHR